MTDTLPWIVTAIPKSGSSLLAECVNFISIVQAGLDKGRRLYPAWWQIGNGFDWDLRPEMIYMYRNPTWRCFKSHFWASGKNLAVLDAYPMKYVILLRAPRDQLAAEYCSALYHPVENQYNPIFPVDADAVNKYNVDDSMDYMINKGYLAHSLLWMTDWLLKRHTDRSLVVRYEDLLADPFKCLSEIAQFFCGCKLDKNFITQIYNRIAVGMKASSEQYSDSYPRGWTGKPHIWRDYYSEANVAAFEAVWKQCMALYPGATMLQAIYPEGINDG